VEPVREDLKPDTAHHDAPVTMERKKTFMAKVSGKAEPGSDKVTVTAKPPATSFKNDDESDALRMENNLLK